MHILVLSMHGRGCTLRRAMSPQNCVRSYFQARVPASHSRLISVVHIAKKLLEAPGIQSDLVFLTLISPIPPKKPEELSNLERARVSKTKSSAT